MFLEITVVNTDNNMDNAFCSYETVLKVETAPAELPQELSQQNFPIP